MASSEQKQDPQQHIEKKPKKWNWSSDVIEVGKGTGMMVINIDGHLYPFSCPHPEFVPNTNVGIPLSITQSHHEEGVRAMAPSEFRSLRIRRVHCNLSQMRDNVDAEDLRRDHEDGAHKNEKGKYE